MRYLAAIVALALTVPACYAQSQNIADYIKPPPLGTAMENDRQQLERRITAEEDAMSKIESLGLYAVVMKSSVNEYFRIMDGSSELGLDRGDAFPFLGFSGYGARLRIGTSWFEVPAANVTIVRLADLPQAGDTYRAIMVQLRADRIAQQQQDALDQNNQRLAELQENQERLARQQQLLMQRLQQQINQMHR
ncbi:MAG: hypothetical protein WDN28_18875 [Chthoniobacter sp.]